MGGGDRWPRGLSQFGADVADDVPRWRAVFPSSRSGRPAPLPDGHGRGAEQLPAADRRRSPLDFSAGECPWWEWWV